MERLKGTNINPASSKTILALHSTKNSEMKQKRTNSECVHFCAALASVRLDCVHWPVHQGKTYNDINMQAPQR